MQALLNMPIAQKWPPQHPERLQLYSAPTPNGVKVSIMLEETGLPYEAHLIHPNGNDQYSPEYTTINPNNRMPAIVDPNGPNGQVLPLFESSAILYYLAQKTGQLLPQNAAEQHQCLQWLFFQAAGMGPMMGQVGFFYKYAGSQYEDKRPLERYLKETTRLFKVLNQHLEGKQWMMGDEYTIADIAIFPWIRSFNVYYEAGHLVDYDSCTNIHRVLEKFLQRPAVARGLFIPEVPDS